MKYFFSESTGGFYAASIHNSMPNDAIPVSDSDYLSALIAQSEGKSIKVIEGKIVALDFPQNLTSEALKEKITNKRWQIETGGLTLPSGVHVATGIDDQNRITSVIANAELAGVEVVDFKAASGWVSVTVAELKAVAAAIALHVQQCFTAERMHHEAIDAIAAQHEADPEGLQAALAAYDVTQGWPATDLRDPQPAE